MNIDCKSLATSQKGIALALTIAMLVFMIFFFSETIFLAFPVGDEFSLIIGSKENPINWILDGYSDYFRVYDEYFVPYTNFIRPMANLLYSIFSYTPAPMSYQLVFVNYLVHSLTCTLVYLIALSFGNSIKFSLAVTATAFLAPAFWLTPAVSYPSFALDALAALFCLSSLWVLFKGQYFLGFLCLVAGVFTKETALPMAVVWMFFGIQRNSYKAIFLSFLSLLLWFTVRFFAFNDISGGTYSFDDFSIKVLFLRLSMLSTLPLGNFSIESLKELVFQPEASMKAFFLAANVAAWLLSIRVFLRSGTKVWSPRELLSRKNDFSIFFIALVGSVCFYVLIGGSARFSYLTYALWIIAIGATKNSLERLLVVSVILISSIISFPAEIRHVSEKAKFLYNQSSLFSDFLKENEFSGDTYVFNDFLNGYSRQQYVASYSGVESKFYRGSSIAVELCSASELKLINTSLLSDNAGNTLLKVELPACASFRFEGANLDKLLLNIEENYLLRNKDIRYEFRDLKFIDSGFTGNTKIDFGKYLEIIVSPNVNVLFFDFRTNAWVAY